MPSPFCGMNPYLEHPELWPGFHHLLISEMVRLLAPQLRPKYLVSLEVRMYESSEDDSLLIGIPDVIIQRPQTSSEPMSTNVAVADPPAQPMTVKVPVPLMIRQGYLEIREVATKEVVTAIELLSPSNKKAGKGRQMYQEKREEILGSKTNLVEIDLLRNGQPMPMMGNNIDSHYRLLICRGNRRPLADLYAFNLQQQIPSFSLPLRREDSEPVIDLQALLNGIYDIAGYDLKIDYNREPVPALLEGDSAWVDAVLRQKQLRG